MYFKKKKERKKRGLIGEQCIAYDFYFIKSIHSYIDI